MKNSVLKTAVLGCAAGLSLLAFGGEKLIKDGDTLVFMGDSITRFGVTRSEGYVHLVIKGLAANGINVTWYGQGYPGDTTTVMLNRFKLDVLDLHPDVVTINGGVNDCGKSDTGTPLTYTNMLTMAQMSINAGITPVLMSPTTGFTEADRPDLREFAGHVKQYAEDLGVPYAATFEGIRAWIDASDPANPVLRNEFKATDDGAHMAETGNRVMAREVLKAFGFGDTEMANAEAAWANDTTLIHVHPSVKVTAAELAKVKAAAARAGVPVAEFPRRLFGAGAESLVKTPAAETSTEGAAYVLSSEMTIGYGDYDNLLEAARQTGKTVETVVGYALLRGVHECPDGEAPPPSEPVPVDPAAFAKNLAFSVSGYTGASTLTNFPVLVRLAEDSPDGFRYADLADGTTGSEIRFADAAGFSLPYEIEKWDPAGTSVVWVRLPELAAGTSFTMYYGGTSGDAVNATDVWSADYVGVWHMGEDSGAVADATGHGNAAVPQGKTELQVSAEGVIGRGRVNSSIANAYSGRAYLSVPDVFLLDVGETFTVSGWVKLTGQCSSSYMPRVFTRKSADGDSKIGWDVSLGYTTLNGRGVSSSAVAGSFGASALDRWVHVAAVYDGGTLTLYADGEPLASGAISPAVDDNEALCFGSASGNYDGHVVGLFDEFRLRDAVATADWMKAEFAQAGTSFLTVGGFEGPSRDGVTVSLR